MDTNNLIKIIAALITVLFAIFGGIIELRKNPEYWLNRLFAGFFVFAGFGFLFYTLYHMVLSDATLTISLAIVAQAFLQISLGCLLMTEFVIEYSEKKALTLKLVLIPTILTSVFIIGYFVWPISLNFGAYSRGEVDTITPTGWFVSVFIYRILLMLYVLIKFIIISRKADVSVKQQLNLFIIGLGIVILGTLLTLLGGSIGTIFEVGGLALFNIGSLLIFQGLIKKTN